MSLKLYTAEEVAEILALKPSTVKTLAKNGKLVGMRQGIEWRFRESNIASYIDNLEKNTVKLEFKPKKATNAVVAPVAEVVAEIADDTEDATEPKIRQTVDVAPKPKLARGQDMALADDRIVELRKQGIFLEQVAEMLNTEGFTTAKGLQWSKGNLKTYINRGTLKARIADEVPM